jgi:hypothetical protein
MVSSVDKHMRGAEFVWVFSTIFGLWCCKKDGFFYSVYLFKVLIEIRRDMNSGIRRQFRTLLLRGFHLVTSYIGCGTSHKDTIKYVAVLSLQTCSTCEISYLTNHHSKGERA